MTYKNTLRFVITVVLMAAAALMMGCGGQAATPQSTNQPTDVLFNGKYVASFDNAGQNFFMFDANLTQQDKTISGSVLNDGNTTYGQQSLKNCIQFTQATITGTISGPNWAMIIADPFTGNQINITSTGPTTGTFNLTFKPGTCNASNGISGTVTIQQSH